jgi:hypothetical protein
MPCQAVVNPTSVNKATDAMLGYMGRNDDGE